MVEIKPCPFCGAIPDTEQDESGARYGWFSIECQACGAVGPDADSSDAAWLVWNKRAGE